MPKNLVICCDGTGNEYGQMKSNVVKLHETLVQSSNEQITFYDPGVGTFSINPAQTKPGKIISLAAGLAFGRGLRENIIDAYQFLMQHYKPGDRIYIFGFSRGAYTARVVASMIRGVGILREGSENLIPYALQMLEMRKQFDFEVLNGFRKQFSYDERKCLLPDTCTNCKDTFIFLGLWDTVSSVAWFWDNLKFQFSATNKCVDVVRHALSIDERRAFFRTNLCNESIEGQDVKQVWFAGVHSDVGGSYPEEESGLSQIALEWMVNEAIEHKLLIKNKTTIAAIYSKSTPNLNSKIHRSLKHFWWLCEIVPKLTYKSRHSYLGTLNKNKSLYKASQFRINLARRRRIRSFPLVHESVLLRMQSKEYSPKNLPSPFKVEPFLQYKKQASKEVLPKREIDPSNAIIWAILPFNKTSFWIEKGKTYKFSAQGVWYDRQYEHHASGNASPNWFMRIWAPFRRSPTSNWFTVIGCIDKKWSSRFDIGRLVASEENYTATKTGRMYCYANDLRFMYWNNRGHISLQVEETPN